MMKKNLLSILLSFTFFLSSNAQNAFQKTFGTYRVERETHLCQNKNKDYIFFCLPDYTGLPTYVVKTDSMGNKMWSKFLTIQYPHRIIPMNDGGCLISGNHSAGKYDDTFLVRLDALGNIVWQKEFSYPAQGFYQMQEDIDHSGIIIGGGGFGFSCLMKIDDSGNIIWLQHVNFNYILSRFTIGPFVQLPADSCFYA